MSASSIATSLADPKAANHDRPAPVGQVSGSSATSRKPKRPGHRLLVLCVVGALILASATYCFIDNAGYESTDDATIEAHVIQVSPKISAHVKAVHFDDNYQVKRGDLLIELDPRDYEVNLASAVAQRMKLQWMKHSWSSSGLKVKSGALGGSVLQWRPVKIG